ncbi:hypothetical protein B7463_g7448, partial [Scytalidium lignicola]
MATPTVAAARSENSCRRCHQRKKKCDRLLPQCEACKKARVSCSFLDQGDHVGSFPIAYVRGLERRVRELEKQLSQFETLSPGRTFQSDYPIEKESRTESEFGLFTQDHDLLDFSSPAPVDLDLNQASPTATGGTRDRDASLAAELELLSLEATAERHLGSSSGVSFAKLTQAILRRLSPDKSSFVFEDDFELELIPDANAVSPPSLDFIGSHDINFLSLSSPPAFSSFPLWEQLGDPDLSESVSFPPEADTARLTDFYWAHSHTLYPIIHKNEFMKVLWRVYEDPQDPHAQSPLWLFRIWMVLAIGSTAYSSVSLVDESESVMFFNRAMTYFEGALGCGDMAALEVLMLQVSYSFFNQIGPNTWFLVGVAARMALGMGLHTSSAYQNVPVNVSEHRKRLFFSLYMMDRMVSMALGRPFAMRDDDIDVEPFADADDENIKPDKIIPQGLLQPSSMAVPLHILALRRIASEIGEKVYSSNKTRSLSPEQRDQIIQDIHKKLIEWRRSMPFPLPDSQSRVPHLITSWFDLNYYTHVTMLYRPSPLCPTLDIAKIKILAEASAMSIRQATNMHHQQRFAYNWLNLFGVFTSSLTLMYSITVQPDLTSVLSQTDALNDLELAMELLGFVSCCPVFTLPGSKMNSSPDLSFDHLAGVVPRTYAVYFGTVLFLYLLYRWSVSTDIPYIKGIPEIPGAIPIVGHLLKLGDDHASVCEGWWKKSGDSVFQIRLGNTRAVVVNSFDDCRKMLVGNQSALIDRPKLYTFHGIISSTQGFTIGSSPWDESCKNKRKAAGTALGRPALRSYYPMFDLESYCIVRDLWRDSKQGDLELNIRPFIQRYALNTTLTLCYGIRMDEVYDKLLREILFVGSAISLLRSASENYQDYVPILRYLPNNKKNIRSKELRDRRDVYLNLLLDKVRDMIKMGTDKPCISSAILKDEETKLTGVEVSSICLSLVSGGFETIPGTLTSCLGSLSTPEGQIWQERAYQDIKRYYPDIREAWKSSYQEEKVPYINAIIKEAGRYYTVSSMSLPRKTVSEVNWNGAIIPPKTMVLINAQAGNHDVGHFGTDAGKFDPERFLDSIDPPVETPSIGLNHLSFGAGARACSGQFITPRLLYTALVRIITSFKIVASETEPPNTDYVDYNQFKTALVAIPRDFKVKLIPRDPELVEECLKDAQLRTVDHYRE